MIRFLLSLVVVSICIGGKAQSNKLDDFKGWKPRFIGPAGMSGRVTSIDVDLSNTDHFIFGTASGGVWETFNEGISFQPIFDDQPTQSVGAVAIDQSNPTVMWVGTGEGNPRNSQSSGRGIFKSIDGGKTWKCKGLVETKTIHRIIVHPENSNVVFVAALGSAWGSNSERGVFKTTDGGETWEKVLFVNDLTGCADLVVDPDNPNKLIASMWEYERKPWFFTSGGEGSGLYISYDAGKSWKKKLEKDGLPKGQLGRIGLAIARNKPNVLYALVEAKKTGLYKSINGGESWKLVSTKNIGNRPFYYADIYVDPTNENRLYNLFSYVTKSEDGGKTFAGITPYSTVHPDHHAFWIHPENGNFIIDGNDGGLTLSKDGGKNWRYCSNLPLGQFYHINIDDQKPYNIYGGLQDNGSWVGPAYVYEHGGIKNHHWSEVLFGDGFDVMPNLKDTNKLFAMYQGGNLYEVDKLTGKTSYIQPVSKDSIPLRFSWNAALAQDPFNKSGIYFGSQYVHYSEDAGKKWIQISPDLTTNDTLKQKQAKSGGLTIDATRAENHTTILCITPSSLDSNVIWVGTDDGKVQVTRDRGKTWSNVSIGMDVLSKGAWVPQIYSSTHNPGEVYVVVNNYRQNDWKPYLFKTSDYGRTWKNLVNTDKVDGYCLSVQQDFVDPNLIFLGTQVGLYVSFDGGNEWEKWSENIPSVPIRDMKIHPKEHDLILGTFGRSIIVLDDISPLRESMKKESGRAYDSIWLFKPSQATLASWTNTKGIRFTGHSEFKGENRPSGLGLSVWVSKEYHKKHKDKKTQKLELDFWILNTGGDTLRYLRKNVDTLFNRIYIAPYSDGLPFLKREYKVNKKRVQLPAGVRLKSGAYRLIMGSDSLFREVQFEVNEHQVRGMAEEDRAHQEAVYNDLGGIAEAITMDLKKLAVMKRTVKKVNSNLQLLENDSVRKRLKKDGKQLLDEINQVYDLYFLPKDFNGYDHVTENISVYYNRVKSYVRAENLRYSSGYELAKQQLLNAWEKAHKQLVGIEDELWAGYKEQVNGERFDYFKPYKELETLD